MKKGRFLLRWAGVAALLAAFSLTGMQAMGETTQPGASGEPRADIIVIDSLGAFGTLEEAPVAFEHDRHTEALKKLGKDCSACHESEKGILTPRFKRTKDESKDKVKDIYHANCIGCHKDIAATGKDSGPTDVSCRSCHTTEAPASAWRPIHMDKSLHYRHIASKAIPAGGEDANCAACHHKYDEASKKLVPAKGEEQACASCHGEKAKDDVKSLQTAAHMACVSCHVNVAASKADSGPTTCEGCHSEAAQAKIKVVKDVPRLKRNQPDAVLMTLFDAKAPKDGVKGLMRPVSFNHKLHEAANDSCSSCHHKTLESCSTCHTVAGDEKGGFVKLEEAMHAADSRRSCVGCHKERTVAKDCAGCHSQMPAARPSDESCATCHTASDEPVDNAALATMSKEDKAAMAAAMVQARSEAPKAGLYDLADVPEKIVIGDLADKYEAAEFPHRKIIESMYAKVKTSDLAATFHTTQGTFCQGCHHNSPASKTPPRCASCHGRNFDAAKDARPGLKAAFHQQCIGCHTAMQLEKPKATACADCHKERKK